MSALARYTARDLLGFGYAILVLEPGTKEPLGSAFPHGVYSATRDVDYVEGVLRRNAGVRLALALPDGVRVVDEDPRNGGAASLADLEMRYGPLPLTPMQRTGGGGRHFLLRALGTLRTKIATGVEFLGLGKYIVLHDGPACGWEIGLDHPVADAPHWLLDLARAPIQTSYPRPRIASTSKYARAALERESSDVANAPTGARNETLNRAAFALARFLDSGELSEIEIVETLVSSAALAGLRGPEIRKTIRSGIRGRSK